MKKLRKSRSLVPVAVVALFAVALLAPAAKSASVPPFTSTAQYQALVKYVDKLDGLAHTPATTARKAVYGDQLENKHESAVNKSTALFRRGKKVAGARAQRAFKSGVAAIRRTEASELAALRRAYDSRMDRAAANFQAELGRVEDVFDARDDALRRQIKRLRKQKANANSVVRKAEIQAAIERRNERLADNRILEREEITDLKTGYRREKAAIRAGKASATRVVQQTDDEAIETLRNQSNRIYRASVQTLQNRRVNQIRALERKLNAGKRAIERMPTIS
jgi:hypothetical protein